LKDIRPFLGNREHNLGHGLTHNLWGFIGVKKDPKRFCDLTLL
jgi:hypothetical protein